MTSLKAIATTALVASAALSWTVPAKAGHNDVGAGLLGFGVGAIVGSALTPHEVYIAPPPPPPPPAYYGPAAYGPPAWSPAWYQYCRSIHGPNLSIRDQVTSKRPMAVGIFAARLARNSIVLGGGGGGGSEPDAEFPHSLSLAVLATRSRSMGTGFCSRGKLWPIPLRDVGSTCCPLHAKGLLATPGGLGHCPIGS